MEDFLKGLMDRIERSRIEREFETVERRKLTSMSDKDLAAWQAKYPPDSPQCILASFEWQRRLTAEQIKATRFSTWIGVIATLAGVFLGWLLAKFV